MVPSVGEVCGYASLDDYKKVLEADSELFYNREELRLERLRTVDLTKQVGFLQGQVDVLTRTQAVLLEADRKLTNDLIVLDKKYQDERVKPRWGTPVAWGVAGVSLAVLAGVLLAGVL